MSMNRPTVADADSSCATNKADESLIDYMEEAPQPLPPRDPIGPPDVQPAEAPIQIDE
jgi:hypothetical protein